VEDREAHGADRPNVADQPVGHAAGGAADLGRRAQELAPWGELLTTAASLRGAAGCLTDGLVRDVRRIREMRFPVFAGGIGPLDSKGRAEMAAMDIAVEVAGVRIEPGDLVFGDVDGCVAIPKAVAPQVVARALEKVTAEDRTRDALAAGESLRQVFERFGVL